jgi:hypothetical protein
MSRSVGYCTVDARSRQSVAVVVIELLCTGI